MKRPVFLPCLISLVLVQDCYARMIQAWCLRCGGKGASFVPARTSFSRWNQRQTPKRIRPYSSSPATTTDEPALSSVAAPPEKVAIVGGGLAGLSCAFHILNKTQGQTHVTVYDKCPVGTGGASAAAGGLLHPLSPRGKLVYWGLEGLEATNRLLNEAAAAASTCSDESSQRHEKDQQQHGTMILRDELYRVATTAQHVEQLQATALLLPNICTWKQPDELPAMLHSSNHVLGALLLQNGCKVVHVPSYLQALWKACERLNSAVVWSLEQDWRQHISEYDAVVYAAGSGLFEQQLGASTDALLSVDDFPIQLVRGQSAELKLSTTKLQEEPIPALLCGKYISPLPNPNMVLVGATHEFRSTPMDRETVMQELKERTQDAAPWIWGDDDGDDMNGPHIHHWASGIRVQSERGKNGRMPLIGLLATEAHPNTWIFTGLSSRGLLYHGIYGDILTDAILENKEDIIHSRCEDLSWWKAKAK